MMSPQREKNPKGWEENDADKVQTRRRFSQAENTYKAKLQRTSSLGHIFQYYVHIFLVIQVYLMQGS
jgi:hypothetical protein